MIVGVETASGGRVPLDKVVRELKEVVSPVVTKYNLSGTGARTALEELGADYEKRPQ